MGDEYDIIITTTTTTTPAAAATATATATTTATPTPTPTSTTTTTRSINSTRGFRTLCASAFRAGSARVVLRGFRARGRIQIS